MEFQYQPEILAQLLTHGVRPLPRTRPALVFRYLGELYRYELRRLKRLREEGAIPQREYGGRVVGLRRQYPARVGAGEALDRARHAARPGGRAAVLTTRESR